MFECFFGSTFENYIAQNPGLTIGRVSAGGGTKMPASVFHLVHSRFKTNPLFITKLHSSSLYLYYVYRIHMVYCVQCITTTLAGTGAGHHNTAHFLLLQSQPHLRHHSVSVPVIIQIQILTDNRLNSLNSVSLFTSDFPLRLFSFLCSNSPLRVIPLDILLDKRLQRVLYNSPQCWSRALLVAALSVISCLQL